jgi:hypothetical protein
VQAERGKQSAKGLVQAEDPDKELANGLVQAKERYKELV